MDPRPIIPGTTYLVTRRTTQQLFLMVPNREINACIRYCMAVAQRRAPVEIHCAIVLSNHYHLVVTDIDGRLPEFTEEFNKLVGSALNRYHGRRENFWASGVQVNQVQLATPATVLRKIVYSLVNPTKALLVSHGSKWPGIRLYRKGKLVAKKPKFFFRSEEIGGELPDTLPLIITAPPIGVDPRKTDEVVTKAVGLQEKLLRNEAKAAGKTFMGAAKVKAQKNTSSPKTTESKNKSKEKRKIIPRVACGDSVLLREILAALTLFVSAHKKQRAALVEGSKKVLFPFGTYKMVRHFGANCDES